MAKYRILLVISEGSTKWNRERIKDSDDTSIGL